MVKKESGKQFEALVASAPRSSLDETGQRISKRKLRNKEVEAVFNPDDLRYLFNSKHSFHKGGTCMDFGALRQPPLEWFSTGQLT